MKSLAAVTMTLALSVSLGAGSASAASLPSCAAPGASVFNALSCPSTVAAPARLAVRSAAARRAVAATAAVRFPAIPVNARFSSLSVGGRNVCGYIKANRQVACWGNMYLTGDDSFVNSPLKSISVGAYGVFCGLKVTGIVACDGGRQNPPNTRVKALAMGAYHACVLSPSGHPYCWVVGRSGSRDISEVAEVPEGLPRATAISAGGYHTCIITTRGGVRCWGSDDQGQASVPSRIVSVKQVSAGGFHTCAIDRYRSLRCWGYNYNGQATPPRFNRTARQVSAGLYHTCAVTIYNNVRCWGADDQGQSSPPRGLGPVLSVSAGSSATCALTFSHLVRCWGSVDDNPDFHLTKVLISRPAAAAFVGIGDMTLISSNGRRRSGFCPTSSACQLYVPRDSGSVNAEALYGADWLVSLRISPNSDECDDNQPWAYCSIGRTSPLKPTIVRIGFEPNRPCIVPNVVGLMIDEVEAALSAKRCSLGDVTYDEASTAEVGRVISQAWPVGSFRARESGIGVTVSGPAPS